MRSFVNPELIKVLSNNPSLLKLPVNERGRDWFVGDVHGQFGMLTRAMEAAKFDRSVDRLIGVGDLVDRGRQSFEVLRFFSVNPWAHCTVGNHEVMALRGFQGINSGYVSREDWRLSMNLSKQRKAVEYISKFPIAIEVPLGDGRTAGVIHAELPPCTPWSIVEQAKVIDEDFHDDDEIKLIACLLWSRRHFLLAEQARHDPEAHSVSWDDRLRASVLLQPVEGIDLVIAGHNAIEYDYRPLQVANRLWIDTGSGYDDGRLTLVNPRDGVYVQVHKTLPRLCKLPEPEDLSKFVLPDAEVESAVARIRATGRLNEFLYQRE